VAETEPSLQIERMYLTSNADNSIVTALRTDLRTLASRVGAERTAPTGQSGRKILELELQTCLRRLSELLRRRRWEASDARLVLSDDDLPATSALAWAASSGEAVETDEGDPRSSLLQHPLVTAEHLAGAAEEIEERRLDRDLNVGNAPAGARAHVYWRRDPSRMDVDKSIRLSATMFLGDTSSSRPATVVIYVGSVIAISYLLSCIMFGSFRPLGADAKLNAAADADAIVAVLLLVPGFLYTRLNLPARRSIAGHLRALPRLVTHVGIFCAALLAATIAASKDAELIQAALAACMVVPALATAVMLATPPAVRPDRPTTDPWLPDWAKERRSAGRYQRLRAYFHRPDAVLRKSGADDDDPE